MAVAAKNAGRSGIKNTIGTAVNAGSEVKRGMRGMTLFIGASGRKFPALKKIGVRANAGFVGSSSTLNMTTSRPIKNVLSGVRAAIGRLKRMIFSPFPAGARKFAIFAAKNATI